ncbi:hypothetical protein RRG08_040405 [Elysia crispata]|uniref:Uncharacterized protein n=1 Tax=Elysia crispata TaxID=231223 RepID=A0AAE0ZDR4_9GAST|nr:hypothetical protein RRG08_040405 [Elysia crispata]
MYDYGIFQTT